MTFSLGRLLREPLLHFAVLGAICFGAYEALTGATIRGPDEIVITQGRIDALTAGFARTWRRTPTQQELDGLIDDFVREEIYYREALALGLERDDIVIRRRLRQKMEFVSEDTAAAREPTDDELLAYYERHAATYRNDARVSFRHVFLDPQRRGAAFSSDAAALLARLQRAPDDYLQVGDATLLEPELDGIPIREAAQRFGAEFTQQLRDAPVGRWSGPIASAYGQHLVFIEARTEEAQQPFETVRDDVQRDWSDAHRRESNEAFYQALRRKYDVTIERARS